MIKNKKVQAIIERALNRQRLTTDQIVELLNVPENSLEIYEMMATADYPFEEFLRMSETARKYMSDDMMLSANIGDFGKEEAKLLKQAGYGRIYHVIRLGEGQIIEIDPEERIKTIEAAASENLEIAFCIEPIGEEHSSQEIAEKIELSLRFKPTTAAVMRRVPIQGSSFEACVKVPEARMAHIMAVMRLAYSFTDTKTFYIHEPSLPGLMSGANMICAETAGNPREMVETGESIRGYSVSKCRELLIEAGYSQRKEPNFPGSWFNKK